MSKLKVTDAVGSKAATFSEIKLDLDAPKAIKSKIQQEVGEFLVEQVLASMSKSESPVEGGEWKPDLSPKYKKKKISEGLGGKPDLEASGGMKDQISFKKTDDGIKLGVFGDKAWQADGHVHFSTDSKDATAPKRAFLPEKGQTFDDEILDGVEKIIADNLVSSEALSKEDFEDIGTRQDLYDTLEPMFPDLSRLEIKAAILRDPRLTNLLEELELLELL